MYTGRGMHKWSVDMTGAHIGECLTTLVSNIHCCAPNTSMYAAKQLRCKIQIAAGRMQTFETILHNKSIKSGCSVISPSLYSETVPLSNGQADKR